MDDLRNSGLTTVILWSFHIIDGKTVVLIRTANCVDFVPYNALALLLGVRCLSQAAEGLSAQRRPYLRCQSLL